jgi:hypothetical protein
MDNGHHIPILVEIGTKIKINKTKKKNKKCMCEMGLEFHISTSFDVKKEFHT